MPPLPHITYPIFPQLTKPHGLLERDLACQALWFYFSCAMGNIKDLKETIRYEGDKSQFNFYNLYKSITAIYRVAGQDMQNFWPVIDAQARMMGLTLMPNEARFRAPGSLMGNATIRPGQ